MSEIHGPGGPLPPIPDNLTVVQFMLDHHHTSRPPVKQSNAWLIEDATERRITLDEIRTRVYGLANALSSLWGIKEDDVVCIFSPNHVDYAISVRAVHRLGATLTTSNPAFTADELEYQLTKTKAKAMIVHPLNLKVALDVAQSTGIPNDRIVVFDDQQGDLTGPYPRISELVADGLSKPPAFVERKLKPGEGKTKLAFLSLSSGTTGRPKAVCIPHHSPIANVIQMAHLANQQIAPWEKRAYRPGDIAMALLPFYHIYGLVVIMHFAIFYGMTLVVIPKFNFVDMLKSIERHRINYIPVVPPIVVMLCKHPAVKDHDLSSLRTMKSGSAPLTAEVIRQLSVKLPHLSIGQSYGMTETCTTVTFPQLEQKIGTPGSAGRLLPGVIARVIDPDGNLLGYGQPGQLVVYSPANSLGYLNNEQATKETFVDGWIYTGDEVIINEQADVFVVDRLKELIKVKGFQVAPAELEGHLLDHPDVSDVCVVGIPDEYSGEVPLAFVVPSSRAVERMEKDQAEIANIKASLKTHVAAAKVHYKHLAGGVEFIDAIPKNPSGKLLRRFLRDRAKKMQMEGKLSPVVKARL
ncbi:amp dependent CoA ligase [Laetiporus sulphureus 93-53]|uniref:Amp dependent CoA ligase n=1 Tax=Laetiporus sulphureus 93-53 TaxID=1314785 RepID=A0A165FK48_9APHY|nr:amp dependent CoA ligase [Laetiporus sulphureus 93-53]KZT09094.1 amp dependent CoA ligase [Laetiporus sulphureus 93-53]